MADLTAEVRAALAAHDAEVSGQRGIIIPGPALQHVAAASPSWLAALCDRLDAAEAKLAAVRKLHQRRAWHTNSAAGYECGCCLQPYPCPTIQALNGDSDE